jgi:hypothetical protein
LLWREIIKKKRRRRRRRKKKNMENLGARVERTVDCNKSNIGQSGRSFIPFRLLYIAGPNRYGIISARTTHCDRLRRESRAHTCKGKPNPKPSQTVQSQWMAAWVGRERKKN